MDVDLLLLSRVCSMKKSKFCVYGLKDLDNPDVTRVAGLAGTIFEGYYVWFSEEDIAGFGVSYWRVGCGIRLTETSHTIAWGQGYTREEAFEKALIDFEVSRKLVLQTWGRHIFSDRSILFGSTS
jgi:hypothetical protein